MDRGTEENFEVGNHAKRFKFKSYNESLKDVHLPGNFQAAQEIGHNESHFHEALNHWRQLNLAPSFLEFARNAHGLSVSMPLLLHNWRRIYELWVEAFNSADDEGLRALLDLLQKMAQDLRTTISPVYPALLQRLLGLLPRPISASALTSLLETLSSLFRYLLIPAVNPAVLDETWNSLCSILPKCLAEVQRATAEVWSGVIRRLMANQRDKAVLLVAKSVREIEDAGAWVIIYACKFVSQTLHTCTVPTISTILNYHLTTSPDAQITHTLLRRILTALIHHVNNSDQFSVLGETILQRLLDVLKQPNPDIEQVKRGLDIASIFLGVRQGSRVTESQKFSLFAGLGSLPVVPELHPSLLLYTTSLFMAGDTSHWLGPGLKFLQAIWNRPPDSSLPFNQSSLAFAFKLYLCLADLGWGGWKLIALPLVIRLTVKPELRLIDLYQQQTITFLAALKMRRKLGPPEEIDVVWKRKIEFIVRTRLISGEWKTGVPEDEAAELDDILALSALCSDSITMPLIDTISSTISDSDGNHTARVVGHCMDVVAQRDPMEWSDKINLGLWTKKCLEKWPSSPMILEGLCALAQANPSIRPVPISSIYSSLAQSLLSHSRRLRLACLRLLDCKLIDPQHDQVEVLKRCLQGEEVSLDVQGVRERVLRIGRVGQVVGDEKSADLAVRWLIAQLKVNLRPLWSPAASALSSLGQRFGDLVWGILFEEVRRVTLGLSEEPVDSRPGSPFGAKDRDASIQADNDPWEDERTWRDPNAHNLRRIAALWNRPATCQPLKTSQERFDIQSYEQQLLSALVECSSLVERHNRQLISHFLSLHNEKEDPPKKLPKAKLTAWLTLFAKFTNPKALYSTDALRSIYISLLSHPDRSLQNVSLSCLFTYKSPSLVPYEDCTRALLDDTRWRDELSLLDMDSIPEAARPDFFGVIIRLLYGLMLERRGHGKGGSVGRRSAVLATLASCTEKELGLLISLMLQPFGMSGLSVAEGVFQADMTALARGGVTEKQLVGFLTLLEDVLKNLGSKLVSYWPALLGTTINIIATVHSQIETSTDPVVEKEKDDDVVLEEDVKSDNGVSALDYTTPSLKAMRTIRRLGLKRFVDFFCIPVVFDFAPYMAHAFEHFISPRLSAFEAENIQAPSAFLELFHAWTVDGMHVSFLVDFNPIVLPKVYACLVAENVKPSVILKIFDIVENIVQAADEDECVSEHVFKPYVSQLLSNLSILMARTNSSMLSTPLGQRQISILSKLAQYCVEPREASTLLAVLSPLVKKPSKVVPEKAKVGILKIIGDLVGLVPELGNRDTENFQATYKLLSILFRTLRSRPARTCLTTTFRRLAEKERSLSDLADLLEAINAYSIKRLDEPDFDRRLQALFSLNENLYKSIPSSDWFPILNNMLYFIQDVDELSIRTNASFVMKRFADRLAAQPSSDFDHIFYSVLYPGLKNGLRTKNEQVRAEILSIISYLVETCEHIALLADLKPLLEAGDPEANFFNNVLHVQIHRRSRALQRLADHCDEGRLGSSAIKDIFVPLVGNFITSTSSTDHHLVNAAILATGRMAKTLSWGAYYALVQKYLALSEARDETQRIYIRTVVALLDNFHLTMDHSALPFDESFAAEDDEDGGVIQPVSDTPPTGERDKNESTLLGRIADTINTRLLPRLLRFLDDNDPNAENHNRLMISVGIAAVAKHLPSALREAQVTRLFTILSQILRSRSQDLRDTVRDSLNRIVVNLGRPYLPILFRELRSSLTRGPQLHVLAYVVHSVLLHVTCGEHAASFSNLDDCVNDITHAASEVVFGESAKDIQSDEFKTKMREVRGSATRGLDSFALVAKHVTPAKISSILAPARAVMHETSSTKVMSVVDELLKRITVGLNGNDHLVPTELLALSNTLISQNAKFLQKTSSVRKVNAQNYVMVQMKRHAEVESDHYSSNSHRFVAFGLGLLNTALKRNRFDFRDPAIMTRLEAIVIVVGNTLYSKNASVLTIAMRCVAGLSRCPSKAIEQSTPVVIRQILDTLKQVGSTESELSQVALNSLAIILRDCPATQVKEKDLVYLLDLVSPDLEEPSRQTSVFTLLRAIVARKFVVPEIYDLMERVSEVSVTSQSPQVQELCRGVLLQFLLDYPHGKGRLRNQMAFFTKNLSYVHESGRMSVMELLGAIILKFQAALLQDYAELLFVALVMVIANDESAKCRETAAELIKNLWPRLEEEHRTILLSHLHSWAAQTSQPLLSWIANQVYGFIVDVTPTESSYVSSIVDDLKLSLERSALAAQDDDTKGQLAWQLPYHSLTVISKVLRVYPAFIQDGRLEWKYIVQHLLFPHAWVRIAACRLVGQLFSANPVESPSPDLEDFNPLSNMGMRDVAGKLVQQLKSEHLDSALGLQVVKNLFHIGKCFCLIDVDDEPEDSASADEDSPMTNKNTFTHPLPRLFSALSYQVRSAHIARRRRAAAKDNWSQQPLSCLRWFAAMASHMEGTKLEKFLVHILTPLYRLMDDDTIRDAQMEELKTTATELQDLVQNKVGTTKFSTVYTQIRRGVLEVRRERKVAKVLQASTNPEAAAKRKIQRNVIKKDSRKRKERGFSEAKGRLKRRRIE